ncbi:methylmalonyl-CoA mutase family protein, partial [bacterium]|nr:methylmalonyl-CoA mutase family protein [bacterium]
MQETKPYVAKNKIRFVTAASLFDGHDASINIMRRILQSSGVEVIHLGHNRSVSEIVDCAICEDVQGIAVSSYQGGHIEYFKFILDLLKEKNASHIKIFGGGGGVIVSEEIKELHDYGICKIFSPEDGKELGLQGMINLMLRECDFSTTKNFDPKKTDFSKPQNIAKAITFIENEICELRKNETTFDLISPKNKTIPVLGITGTGGAGKSSLVDEIIRRFLNDSEDKKLAIISVDPSKRKTGGALLGDRIRMNAISNSRVFMRSLATRQSNFAISKAITDSIKVLKSANYDLIIVETSGIGQSDSEIVDISDVYVYVMTSDYGAATQLEKIDMIDFADIVVLNKFDKRGSLDALRDVRKQYKRSRELWEAKDEELPVYGTIASQFNDRQTDNFYVRLLEKIEEKTAVSFSTKLCFQTEEAKKKFVISPERSRYLSEIVKNNLDYKAFVSEQAEFARKLYQLYGVKEILENGSLGSSKIQSLEISANENISEITFGKITFSDSTLAEIDKIIDYFELKLRPEFRKKLENWEDFKALYKQDKLVTKARNNEIVTELFTKSLSQLKIPKVSLPTYKDWGDILRWILLENVPGVFPFTAGVFPFKREGEDPTRMFAGEGTPERTNARFHYVSKGQSAVRLSTAFDSVTLYGEDPDYRPDIYGKVGNSGVSICTLDDMKKLYCGFDLCASNTSVSMTINGPAPMILGFFLNTAIDQQIEKYLREEGRWEETEQKINDYFENLGLQKPTYKGRENPQNSRAFGLGTLGVTGEMLVSGEEYERIKNYTLSVVRGTVQADILKEDQAQNTCIFSTEFALKLMGDVQEYFIEKEVKNYYSVSISGYHIAEAGANPISQLAFTLANGFTYVEYYLSRGMKIDDFAPNLSFFFSNGIDPEYSVIGRVARRIWATAIKHKYNGNERSQKLKYHIQTSGRSLHAQEIDFNDIRTTLQALYAIYDNCNSLHTNAYDEAITTPTEESVRRAMAIQLIINRELGLAKNENPLQGAFVIEELTDLVEEAVLAEFERISERGGVLGAMETMYQRSKIQEESLYYEDLKHNGKFPIIGVNTFEKPSHLQEKANVQRELIRSTTEEKEQQINNLREFWR